jgi:hypothetical protein
MHRVSTRESYVGEISLDEFRGNKFYEKGYLKRALEIVTEGMEKLDVTKEEPIHICTGYILSSVREALNREGYNVITAKITGPTQELAEREFLKSLVRLEIGDMKKVSSMRNFNSFLTWVHKDLDSREKFVKTGWSSWSRHRQVNTL